MFRASLSCIWRVLSLASGGLGVVIALIGSVLQSLDKSFVAPGWAILALGTFLLFIAACQIEWELIQEKAKNAKPMPNVPLEEVVKRIRGKDDIFGPESVESMKVLDALSRIRENAGSGAITVFGVKGLKYLPSGSPETVDALLVRLPIAKSFWESNAIGYMEFLKTRIGVTEDTTSTRETNTGYGYLWFDRREIDAIWPLTSKTIGWRNPIQIRRT